MDFRTVSAEGYRNVAGSHCDETDPRLSSRCQNFPRASLFNDEVPGSSVMKSISLDTRKVNKLPIGGPNTTEFWPEEEEEEHLSTPLPDVTLLNDAMKSVCVSLSVNSSEDKMTSFKLVDENEKILVSNTRAFISELGCDPSVLVKVVSVFGNTGEGKSHTMNHTLFGGKPVFHVSHNQNSGTAGVWAAYDPNLKVICLDTEGLLGVSKNLNQRTRLLLKTLAISDIVIYRTKAERLHNDLFMFLADASKAFLDHFKGELRNRCQSEDSVSTFGPSVLIFHETQHTEVLVKDKDVTPEETIRKRFAELQLNIEAFSSIKYIGTRTRHHQTDFSGLANIIRDEAENVSVRSRRKPLVVYEALKALNEKFTGTISAANYVSFPDQYFTCNDRCMACHARCERSMNHVRSREEHQSKQKCSYIHQYDNRIYLCAKCDRDGKTVVVVPKASSSTDSTWLGLAKYAWSGYILECSNCGVIYRSREYWYGNKDPLETVAKFQVQHIWPGTNPVLQGTHNAARKVLDGVQYLTDTVKSVTAEPSKMLSSWVADQVAPTYWRPNSEITKCFSCGMTFNATDTKHHCRKCGEGFCENCTPHTKPVPERGWGLDPVRVCDNCYVEDPEPGCGISDQEGDEIRVRKYGEVVVNTVGSVASAIEYPIGFIKDSARPTYWIPDDQIKSCYICREEFSTKLPIHHCRACGQGVCDNCSPSREPVPERGWDHPVRTCNNCTTSR